MLDRTDINQMRSAAVYKMNNRVHIDISRNDIGFTGYEERYYVVNETTVAKFGGPFRDEQTRVSPNWREWLKEQIPEDRITWNI